MTTAQERANHIWSQVLHVDFNPTAAIAKHALALKLGPPVPGCQEYTYIAGDGSTIIGQAFALAFCEVKKDDWANVVAYDYYTGEVYVPPAAPIPLPPGTTVGGPVPYSFPAILTQVGANGVEGHPTAGLPFYRLTGAAVLQGVNATLTVTALDKFGHAKIGINVADIFPDGNGEVVFTDGTGTCRFQMTANAAFSSPGGGPHAVVITDHWSKDNDSKPKHLTIGAELSDKTLSLGDWQGQHTEVYLQFTEQ